MIPLVLLALCVTHIFADNHSNHQVNLDDIERDNLLSEKRAKNTKGDDSFDIQQSQTFHTKNLEYYRQQLKELKELQEQRQSTSSRPYQFTHETSTSSPGILHMLSTTPSYHAYKIFASPNLKLNHYSTPVYQRHQNDQVEYITIAPKPKYQYQRDDDSLKAGHEQFAHTYSAGSRDTLSRPITPTVASYLQPHPQPQFIYVQPNRVQPKAIQYTQYRNQANDVQYATSATAAGLGRIESSATPAAVVYSHDDGSTAPDGQQVEQQQNDKAETVEGDPQQEQKPYEQQYQSTLAQGSNQQTNDVQYVPYIGQGPTSHQSYVTMVAIPATYGLATQPIRFTPSVITYSHSSPVAVTPVVGGLRPTIQYLPQTLPTQPTGPLQYVNTNDISEPASAVQYLSQLQDIQYADSDQTPSSPTGPDGSKQFKYAPKHPERPLLQLNQAEADQEQSQLLKKVQYLTSQRVVPLQQTFQYIPQPQINVQPLHQFQAYREPKSLLESYVPSWIVVQRQQQQQQQQQQQRSLNHHQLSASPLHYRYNTIAYSTQQNPSSYTSTNQIKRSTISDKIEKDKKA